MTQARVVIADDESLIRMDLKEMLSGLGYMVVGEAGDGLSAVNLARAVHDQPKWMRVLEVQCVVDGLVHLAGHASIHDPQDHLAPIRRAGWRSRAYAATDPRGRKLEREGQ